MMYYLNVWRERRKTGKNELLKLWAFSLHFILISERGTRSIYKGYKLFLRGRAEVLTPRFVCLLVGWFGDVLIWGGRFGILFFSSLLFSFFFSCQGLFVCLFVYIYVYIYVCYLVSSVSLPCVRWVCRLFAYLLLPTHYARLLDLLISRRQLP